MTRPAHFRIAAVLCALLCAAQPSRAQSTVLPDPTGKQVRDAEAAYLKGVKEIINNRYDAAVKDLTTAVTLNPRKPEYALTLKVAQEREVATLSRQAGLARSRGDTEKANALLADAAKLDPANPVVTEHFAPLPFADPLPQPVGAGEIAQLGGPVHLRAAPGMHNVHERGDAQQVLRDIYRLWGMQASFEPGVAGRALRVDLDDVDFRTAIRIALQMAKCFAVALQPDQVDIAPDTQENRDRLVPLVEETVYVPALAPEQLTELSNIAKNVFDLKQVQISNSGGQLILRGPEDALDLVNATYAGLLDGGAEVLLDVSFYEVDRTKTRDIGAVLPSSAQVFSVAAEAQNFVSQNQAALNQLIAAGFKPTAGASYLTTIAEEAYALILAGVAAPADFANALGFFGSLHGSSFTYNGKTYTVPLAGISLGSAASFSLALNASDTRTLDFIQMRVSDGKSGTFRVGSRYPITTSTYSTALPSSVTSALAGVNVNGTPASQLLAQYQSSATTIPQIQYEDLGLTMKATPQVMKSGDIALHLELKLEALGGGSLDSIPILNSRALTQDVTIPAGQSVMLASEASLMEIGAIDGVPGLSDIPGFTGTEKSRERDTQEVLVLITPHVVRARSPLVTSRRLAANLAPTPQ